MQKKFIVYKSSAGSGKTYTLVKEYLKLALSESVKNPKAYRKILAITFTNKAAAEMKLRIIDALKQISEKNTKAKQLSDALCSELNIDDLSLSRYSTNLLSEILHNYSDFAISTIDSFTHKIVKTFAHDLKLPVNFSIETNTNEFYQKVVSGLMTKIGDNKELTELLIQYASNNAQENNSWDPELKLIEFTGLIQKEDAAFNLDKLKNYSKEQLKEIQKKLHAFTGEFKQNLRKAGNDALNLIKKQNLTDANFSYGKSGPQNCFKKWANFSTEKVSEIVSKRTEDAIHSNKWAGSKNSSAENASLEIIQPQLNKIARQTLDYIYTNQKKFSLYSLLEKNIYSLILVNELQQISEEFRAEEQIVFISEFNSKISEIVSNEPSPFIYERLGERYSHFLLDEFQDTSSLQWLNLLPLIDNSLSSGKFNLIVGDGKQSIYRWRNANVQQFNILPKVEGAATNPVIAERESSLIRNYEGKVLNTNYRSFKEIVEFNNSVFDYLPEKLLADKFKSIYESQRQEFKHKEGGYVSVNYGETEKDNLDDLNFSYIHQQIQSAIQSKFSYSDICIIVRNNKHGNSIANHLIENNIPVISSDSLLLSNSVEVNCIISFLRYLNNPFDTISAASVVNYIAKKETLPLLLNKFSFEKDLFSILNYLNINIATDSFSQKNVFDCCVEIITKLQLEEKNPQYIRFFLDEVNDYLVNKTGSVNDFLIWWDKRKEQASLIIPDGTNAVRIMTIHKSKGLEFPVVILPFVNWKVFQSDNAWVNLEGLDAELPVGVLKISSGIEEAGLGDVYELEKNEQYLDSLNLLYVAFTRAVERLHIISYKTGSQKGDYVSSWLKDYLEFTYKPSNGFIEFGVLDFKKGQSHHERLNSFDISTIRFNQNKDLVKIKGSYNLKVNEENEKALENGIKMHYILSEINSVDDIEIVLEQMTKKGIIIPSEKDKLSEKIHAILIHPLIKDYYTGAYPSKNEAEIITESGEILRPDKIVLLAKEAVIIDYKTGQTDTKKYSQQMEKYSDALLKMGYTTTRKILLYLDENLIEELA